MSKKHLLDPFFFFNSRLCNQNNCQNGMGLKVQLACKVEDSQQLQGRVVIKILSILIYVMHWLIRYNSSCTAHNKWNSIAKGKFWDSCVAVKSYIGCFNYPVLNMPCIYLVQFSMAELTKEISQDILQMFARHGDFIQTNKTKQKQRRKTHTHKTHQNQPTPTHYIWQYSLENYSTRISIVLLNNK